MDPVFLPMHFHLMVNSFFIRKKYLFFLENDWESPLILKGKQNKKKNSKCDSLFGKDGLQKKKKTKSGLESQVTY